MLMTTIDTRPEVVAAPGEPTRSGRAFAVVASWVTTTDHKRIGRLFTGLGLVSGLGVAVVAALLGLDRIDPDTQTLSSDSIAQLFSLYRVGLVVLVIAPLALGICIAIVPLQLGARALAYPRMAMLGFWTWLGGGVVIVVAYANNGGPGGGDLHMVDLYLYGLGLCAVGLVLAAVPLATSVMTTRAPGMRLSRVPMLAWSALVGAIGTLVTMSVLFGTLVLVAVDHHYGRLAFGGNKGISQWLGSAFTTPAVFVYVVPLLGAVLDVLATITHRRLPLRGFAIFGISIAASAMLGAATQLRHDWTWQGSDHLVELIQDVLPYALFHLLPIAGVLVVLLVGTMTLMKPSPALNALIAGPTLFVVFGLAMVLAGFVSNALLPINNLALAGTVYEEGVVVFVAYGAVLLALGAIAFWGPKLWGRCMPDKAVVPLALLGALATVLAALPLLFAGFNNQPASAVTGPGFDNDFAPKLMNTLVFVGHVLFVLTILAFALLALRTLRSGEAAGDDPWDGQTLEWATSSPPPEANFAEVPLVHSPEPLFDLKPSAPAATGSL
jgi:heme/copper-type cytochrome/quinol oxidase subunit 1